MSLAKVMDCVTSVPYNLSFLLTFTTAFTVLFSQEDFYYLLVVWIFLLEEVLTQKNYDGKYSSRISGQC